MVTRLRWLLSSTGSNRSEFRKLLTADWRPTSTGREAKFYSLTKKGRQMLAAESASWERLAKAVALILQLSEGETT